MGWITEYAPRPEELSACVDCGLCLPHCPTYRLTRDEAASPRGRIAAMRAIAAAAAPIDENFEELMSFCLQCRACETACPSLVPFGRAMEGARIELAAQRSDPQSRIRQAITRRLVGTPGLVTAGTRLLRLLQSSGVLRLLPRGLGSSVAGMRSLRFPSPSVRGSERPGRGQDMGTVGLLSGCVMDPWFGGVHDATIELLTRAGYRVVVPAEQTCCGALAAHDGDGQQARKLAARNVGAFRHCDLVVSNAAGCSAHLKEYFEWAGDGGAILAERMRDVTEVIAGAIEDGRLPRLTIDRGPVAVQDPCHLRHAQGIVDAPRAILRAAGYRPVDLAEDQCCGAAGLYTVLRPETSQVLGESMADQIRATGSTLVASANPGCEMQLRAYLDAWYLVAHPIEMYWAAVQEDETRSPGAES